MKALVLFGLLLPACALAQVDPPTDDYALPHASAQDSAWVRYGPDFVFHDGIYFDHTAFRQNRPSLPKARLLERDQDPLRDLKRFRYLDSAGVEHRIQQDSVWGFASGDHVYVRSLWLPLGPAAVPTTDFVQLRILGTIAHAMFNVQQRYVDPGYMGTSSSVIQAMQVLLHVGTGTMGNASGATIRAMIADDADLLKEFDALPKRKRNDDPTIFQFLRRYNERHPLYFPR